MSLPNTAPCEASSQSKKASVAEQTVLRDLRIAGAHFARRKRRQNVGVGQHEARLMESADQVLALRRVDARLAADGAVNLRQQRGRDLHEADAAAKDGGGEAREVADDAAAEGNDEITAFQPLLQ